MVQKLVCEKDKCTGCMACVAVCPKRAITIEDSLSAYNAVIDDSLCVDCKLCEKVCQNQYALTKHVPLVWYEGWAKDIEVRSRASSGGVATAIAMSFARSGGYVCSCIFDKGRFTFQLTNRVEDLWKSTGSKYVKSNPEDAYLLVQNALKSGKRVLFIGLPCQVAGMKRFIGESLQSGLYTIDLICHGTPSPKVLDLYLEQFHKRISDIKTIQFRIKAKMQLITDDRGIIKKGVSDCYTISFLNGLNYTKNCYYCYYADTNRVSDITLGDSWGTDRLDDHSKGISLVLCQSQKGQELLELGNVELFLADHEKAVAHNQQLSKPSRCPDKWEWFFNELCNGKRYDWLIRRLYFKQCFKQYVKKWLLELHLIPQ